MLTWPVCWVQVLSETWRTWAWPSPTSPVPVLSSWSSCPHSSSSTSGPRRWAHAGARKTQITRALELNDDVSRCLYFVSFLSLATQGWGCCPSTWPVFRFWICVRPPSLMPACWRSAVRTLNRHKSPILFTRDYVYFCWLWHFLSQPWKVCAVWTWTARSSQLTHTRTSRYDSRLSDQEIRCETDTHLRRLLKLKSYKMVPFELFGRFACLQVILVLRTWGHAV